MFFSWSKQTTVGKVYAKLHTLLQQNSHSNHMKSESGFGKTLTLFICKCTTLVVFVSNVHNLSVPFPTSLFNTFTLKFLILIISSFQIWVCFTPMNLTHCWLNCYMLLTPTNWCCCPGIWVSSWGWSIMGKALTWLIRNKK